MKKLILPLILLLSTNAFAATSAVERNPNRFYSDITLQNGETISNSTDSITCFGGAGGTFNENICFDFDIGFSNVVDVVTTTGTGYLRYSLVLNMLDDIAQSFGTGNDSGILWETTGNDNLQMYTFTGSAGGSGYISIMEVGDQGSANRSPAGTSANPVLRVYSSDGTDANDYIEFTHDQTDAFVMNGTGALKLSPVSTSVVVNGSLTSSGTGSLSWSIQSAANQACTTTCTSAAVHGWDGTTPVDASSALADTCLCAGTS